jgi:TM2 domain-containing membrane protein YozV
MSNIPPLPQGAGSSPQQSQRVLCGIMGILLGGLGIHRFVLGDVTGGVLRLLLSFVCFVGGIIGLIEGIIYLTKSDEEFIRIYQVEKKPWF